MAIAKLYPEPEKGGRDRVVSPIVTSTDQAVDVEHVDAGNLARPLDGCHVVARTADCCCVGRGRSTDWTRRCFTN
jgi:hypothetical protein